MGKTLQSYADQKLAEKLKNYTYYYKYFRRLVTSLFTWENLPNKMSSFFIENNLFYSGFLVCYENKGVGLMVARASAIGINDYDEPTGFHITTGTGMHDHVLSENCVPIYNNLQRCNSACDVDFFAKTLETIKQTFDTNLFQLQNPFIVSCPESQVNTVKIMLSKRDKMEPYIIADKSAMEQIKVQVFNLDIKDNTKNLMEVLQTWENKGLSYFGINNVNVLKKERLITGEAEQNDEQNSICFNSMYKARLDAMNAINDKFNVNIKVNVNKNVLEEMESCGIVNKEDIQ